MQCSLFIKLCLVSIGMDRVISELCFKGWGGGQFTNEIPWL